ncbi:MAG: DUF429 domain-containing protein [Arcicella sp.]|nr:DUF429 domain-containing protein [Microscillaceae bacterium]MCU0471179.1 DUF429 domain-containing protein [Arcicella sp.]
MLIIGIDCASQPENTGVAIGKYVKDKIEIIKVFKGQKNKLIADSLLEELENLSLQLDKAILAIDAPLGWPRAMGQSLASHTAGDSLKHNSQEKDRFFRRLTDIHLHKNIQKLPLEVGADRIARAAYAALQILDDLKKEIQMLWKPKSDDFSGLGVIEVYPAATLKQYNSINSAYKEKKDQEPRIKILQKLGEFYTNLTDYQGLLEDADLVECQRFFRWRCNAF